MGEPLDGLLGNDTGSARFRNITLHVRIQNFAMNRITVQLPNYIFLNYDLGNVSFHDERLFVAQLP